MAPKKATKIDEIFTVDKYVVSVKLTVKISSIFVVFLENTNFTDISIHILSSQLDCQLKAAE